MTLFRFLTKMASDDASIKLAFDHVRNLGLCAVMLGVSQYLAAHPALFSIPYSGYVFAAAAGVATTALVTMNAFHGLKRASEIEHPFVRAVTMWSVNLMGPAVIFAILTARPF